MLVDPWTQLDFLHFDDFLALARLGGLLLFQEPELAIIQQPAYGRDLIRYDLNEVEAGFLRQGNGVGDRQYAAILAFGIDKLNVLDPNLPIDARTLFLWGRGCFGRSANG
jgi:hypothetical protein